MSAEDPEDETVLAIGGLRISPGDRVGPFVYRRLVGKGGMAHVVLASDPDGRPVALKVLKSSRVGTGLTRFKREFRALARLRHPNVIRVDAYGDLYGHPYIAMEYVEGHDLHAAIHAFRTLPADERWHRCEEILVDLCRALAYIHRRGLVHRDLKPSNVLIDASRRCKLTDFGIVKDLDPQTDTAVSTTLVGTWAYASPEQITGQPIDHRSDLYSLGVILFAMLTGRRPFVAKDLAGYLELHRSHEPPAPREVEPGVPLHLDEICRRLLRKQPRDRYRSAQEILYRLEQIEPDAEGSEIAAWEPPLVGRAGEEETLRGRVAALTLQEGGVVWIEGLEGTGKTRLLDVAASQAALMGLPLLRERVAKRDSPLGPLLRLAIALGRELGPRSPAELEAAVQAFSREDAPSSGNARERLVDGLVRALSDALEDGPFVVCVDDLHNAQAPTLDGLAAVTRRLCGEAQLPLLVVAAVLTERSVSRADALRKRGELGVEPVVVRALPLAKAAVGELIAGLVGPGRPSKALADRLYRETEGNALFLALFLQNLMLHGMLARAGAGWRLSADLDEIESGHLDVPPGVRQVVRARLAPVPAAQRPLVEALAVHGREMEIDALLDVLDLDDELAAAHVESLEAGGILRQRLNGSVVLVDFTHSKFADVLYRELEPDRRAELHRKLAVTLELRYANVPAAAEVVGEHYRRAGDAQKAFQYFATAARRLADRGLPDEAWELCQRAESVEDAARVEMGPPEFGAVRHLVLSVKAAVHTVRGEWGEARAALEDAVAITSDRIEEGARIRAHIHLGRALRLLGELDRAEEVVEAHLGRARTIHDREAVAQGLLVLAGVAWRRGELDACEARAQEGLVLATGVALASARAELLLALTAVQATRGQLASAASGLSEAQLLFKELGVKPSRAFALSNLAEVLLGQGDPATAWQHATEALAEAQAARHRLGECVARSVRGQCALACGAFEVAGEEFRACGVLAKALRTPAPCAAHLGRLLLETREPDRALDELDRAAGDLADGDPERYLAEITALRAEALACTGDLAAARSGIREAEAALGSLPVFRRAQVTLDLARVRSVLGQRADARPLARAAAHLASMRGFRLLTLDALVLALSLADDDAERAQLAGEIHDWIRELVASVPSAWQEGFRQRIERVTATARTPA